ncbi:MAG: hypothetical protein INH41_30775 [Myxococcaceae bacterium]|nr:hypothetical protein [Myxococcaceae bacterium]MCA3016791.1 hypothetical protein [Myxococcaceae bacterium]
MSRLVLSLLVVASGCQCLAIVDEVPDPGAPRDAGADAGADGGRAVGAACKAVSECVVPDGGLQFCDRLLAACVNGQCLLECGAGGDAGLGVCASSSSECLTCEGRGRSCGDCNPRRCVFSAQPVRGACPAPLDDFEDFVVEPFSGRCGGALVRDGGVAGVWVGALTGDRSLLDIPALGGTCVGSNLFTGVPRTLVSCPSCTFVATGCE